MLFSIIDLKVFHGSSDWFLELLLVVGIYQSRSKRASAELNCMRSISAARP